jgi:hypothetical protein
MEYLSYIGAILIKYSQVQNVKAATFRCYTSGKVTAQTYTVAAGSKVGIASTATGAAHSGVCFIIFFFANVCTKGEVVFELLHGKGTRGH